MSKNTETLTSTETTTNAKATLKAELNTYLTLSERAAALLEEIETVKAEMSEAVVRMAATGVQSFKHNGANVTIVVNGGKGRNSNFLRGINPPKARKSSETLDLDAE